MDAELLELMSDTLTYEPPSGTYSDRGVPSYGASVSYPCRIEPVKGEVVIRGPHSEERKAEWRIFVGTETLLNVEGRLTLPAGFTPQQPPTFGVGREADEVGSHHQVIYV